MGGLSSAFVAAKEGGQGATDMMDTMRGVLSGLLGFIRDVASAFKEETLGPMQSAGEAFVSLLRTIQRGLRWLLRGRRG